MIYVNFSYFLTLFIVHLNKTLDIHYGITCCYIHLTGTLINYIIHHAKGSFNFGASKNRQSSFDHFRRNRTFACFKYTISLTIKTGTRLEVRQVFIDLISRKFSNVLLIKSLSSK